MQASVLRMSNDLQVMKNVPIPKLLDNRIEGELGTITVYPVTAVVDRDGRIESTPRLPEQQINMQYEYSDPMMKNAMLKEQMKQLMH